MPELPVIGACGRYRAGFYQVQTLGGLCITLLHDIRAAPAVPCHRRPPAARQQ